MNLGVSVGKTEAAGVIVSLGRPILLSNGLLAYRGRHEDLEKAVVYAGGLLVQENKDLRRLPDLAIFDRIGVQVRQGVAAVGVQVILHGDAPHAAWRELGIVDEVARIGRAFVSVGGAGGFRVRTKGAVSQ